MTFLPNNTGHKAVAVLLAALVVAPDLHSAVYKLDGETSDVVGAVKTVASDYEDTFIEIGRANNLGYEELRMANPDIDPWLPGDGAEVLLPTEFIIPEGQREGIIVNIPEYRIYFFFEKNGENYVATTPASIGRMDWETPIGRTGIVAKVRKPSWYPPESVRKEHAEDGRELASVVPPGPDNPLGDYALRLGLPGYLIHGTNRPSGVGMRVTHGCIRLFPEDIEWLFPRVEVKTPVQIINQPLKFGWRGDELFMEVHPKLESAEEDAGMTLVTREFIKVTEKQQAEVDWEQVARVYKAKRGIPVKVGMRVSQDEEVIKLSDSRSAVD